LLSLLDRYGIKAIFFLNGNRITGSRGRHRAQAQIAREIIARGHWIGNHTFSHEQLPLVNNERVAFQLDETRRAFERELGRRGWLLRPPGGARSARTDGLVESRGYTMMMWNLGTGDTQVDDPDLVVETWKRVMERRERENGERGGIILLHDIHQHSVTAFVRIVQELHRRNCVLLEHGEELYDIVDDPGIFFEAREGAAPGTIANPLVLPPDVLEARQARLRVETAVRCARRRAREGV
jgi:peptidoglycan/xylan/chitin deacetylase (PgdA/CDA1 family)